jgi:hypothetical protein
MDQLETALKKFCDTFGRDGEDGFEALGIGFGLSNSDYPSDLPSSPELEYFYSHTQFNDKPVIGGEFFLEIKKTNQLIKVQEGWRIISDKKGVWKENPSWDTALVVIGMRHGDALVVDTSKKGTPVLGSIQQRNFLIAHTLSKFLDTLAEWMICEYREFDMETEGADYSPKPEFLARLQQIANATLDPDETEGFFKFFFG